MLGKGTQKWLCCFASVQVMRAWEALSYTEELERKKETEVRKKKTKLSIEN